MVALSSWTMCHTLPFNYPLVNRGGVVSRQGDILGCVTSIASVLWPGLVQFQSHGLSGVECWGAVKARYHDPLTPLRGYYLGGDSMARPATLSSRYNWVNPLGCSYPLNP